MRIAPRWKYVSHAVAMDTASARTAVAMLRFRPRTILDFIQLTWDV